MTLLELPLANAFSTLGRQCMGKLASFPGSPRTTTKNS